jgi:hypothetical protein
VVLLVAGREKYGNELVAALPDVAPGLFKTDVVVELHHRFVPYKRVQVDGVQKRPVKVENRCFRHSLLRAENVYLA